MYKNKRVLGLIPARGGSKGLPGKNIRSLNKKPLIAWSIEQAKRSKYVDDVVVSTDDKRIANCSKRFGATVPFMRPAKYSTDKSKSIDVIIHALEFFKRHGIEYDYLVLLEPTSPLREAIDIDNSIKLLIDNKNGAVSIVGVAKAVVSHPAFSVAINRKGFIAPYQKSFSKAGRRQDLDETYFFEGTIYVSRIEDLYKRKGFYHDRTIAYMVPKWKSLEIDDVTDMVCAQAIMKNIKSIKKYQKKDD